jgi:hypothetical protein
MGFGTEKQRATYVSIVGGKLSVRAKEGDEGAVSRVNKNNETVWEKLYPSIEGMLQNLECYKNEKSGWQYIITLDDVGEIYKITIPCESKYGDNLACKIGNLKKGEIYNIRPYDFEDREQKNSAGKPLRQTGLSISRGQEKIQLYITKDNPQGRPASTGKLDEEDYKVFMIQVRKFYRSLFDNWGKKDSFAGYEQKKEAPKQVSKQAPSFDDESDLPF